MKRVTKKTIQTTTFHDQSYREITNQFLHALCCLLEHAKTTNKRLNKLEAPSRKKARDGVK